MPGITMKPSTPAPAAALAVSQAFAVVNSAMPVSSGTRSLQTSLVALRTFTFSSSESEQFSPMVPSMISPWMPSASKRFDVLLGGGQIEREIVVELGGDGGVNAVPIDLKGHGTRSLERPGAFCKP